MKIDIWSDFACPFCYIGEKHLELALEKFENRDQVEIEFHSFQLDPNAKKTKEKSFDSLRAKYGASKKQAEEMVKRVVSMAESAGLRYDPYETIETNTFDAHRLAHYAKKEGKGIEMVNTLLEAYLADGADIGEVEVLAEIGAKIGLNKEDIVNILETNEYYSSVKEDLDRAASLGISGVPFFVFNNKYALSGAQPVESFLELLKKLESEK